MTGVQTCALRSNKDRKEFVDVGSLTIEHVMPQNPKLSEQWKQDLGENWKEVQKPIFILLETLL